MKNEMQVKKQVLDMLEKFLMGSDGGKFKPKMMSVEVIHPMKGKEGLDKVLDKASEDCPADEYADKHNAIAHDMSEDEWEGSPGDEEADEEMMEENPRMSLKEFLRSRK